MKWLCQWPSSREILLASLHEVNLVDTLPAPGASAGAMAQNPVKCDGKAGVLVVHFNAEYTANNVAMALDQALALFRGRVYDVREGLMPKWQAKLEKIMNRTPRDKPFLSLTLGEFNKYAIS